MKISKNWNSNYPQSTEVRKEGPQKSCYPDYTLSIASIALYCSVTGYAYFIVTELMKIFGKATTLTVALCIVFVQFIFIPPLQQVYAATSPTLVGASGYSVLGGAAVTNVGTTTTDGSVGVSPGTSITGGTINAAGGTHSNDASAIAAQADTVSAFGALDQTCTNSYLSGQDLTLISPLVPGVYCSAGSFLLTGNLTLTGSGVWIFKTVSTLITSSGSSVTGGDPCNVWWRVGSAATLGTTTAFIGNIVTADVADTTALNTGATLNGRVLAQAAQTVTLAGNTITGPTCVAPTPTPTSSPASSLSSSSGGSGSSTQAPGAKICPILSCITPIILESRRVSPTSIFLSWGPYAGLKTFIVQYGPTNGNWLYNVSVTGFSITLNDLPTNLPMWVLVAPTDGCSTGTCGVAKFIGGPELPNTGFAPPNRIHLYILTSIFIGILGLLIFLQRKYKFPLKH